MADNQDNQKSIIETMNKAEEILASRPSSDQIGFSLDVTNHCSCLTEGPTDRVRLQYGSINNQPKACLYLEVTAEDGATLRCVAVRDGTIPDPVRNAIVGVLPGDLAITQSSPQREEQPSEQRQQKKSISTAEAVERVTEGALAYRREVERRRGTRKRRDRGRA
ncbi:hypothetical protein Mal15_17860 [Stieleria maiorica]|uniref:Uncharacterized protein n=1 Tax=Stieleria maiorica TaxID=2795974 RepID=A0A5B9M982_9BACT|nr:hypothetical protein [Stieleria maiorica]QEF97742.1 hypothetical protein Mal15_17860 [Stieleria maiorica]